MRIKQVCIDYPSFLKQFDSGFKWLAGALLVWLLVSCSNAPAKPPAETMRPTRITATSTLLLVVTPTAPSTITNTPGSTEPSPPVATATPPLMPTPSLTPTQVFPNPLKGLGPGLYIRYWVKNAWYLQGLNGSPPVRFLPFESDNPILRLSPDQTKVAFLSIAHEVTIYDLETGATQVYPNPRAYYINSIDWSPDGQTLLYSGAPPFASVEPMPSGPDFMATYAIYAIRLSENRTDKILDWEGKLDFGAMLPFWSPDGHWIEFYEKILGDYYVESLEPHLLAASCIEEPATCEDAIRDIEGRYGPFFEWLPDGTLAYSCKVREKLGLCTTDLDVPDSTRWLMDLSGSDDIQPIRWLPDRKRFVCELETKVLEDYYTDICTLQLETGQVINLTNTPDIDEDYISLSPDGRYLLFRRIYIIAEEPTSRSYFLGDIYVMPVEGGEPLPVTNLQTEKISASWLAVPNAFQPGDAYTVTRLGDNLNLRSGPALSNPVLKKLVTGDQITILEGPIEADEYTWWKMRAADGTEGWAVDVVGWYELAAPTTTPTP
jgi:Tol biopolymer transport system component